MIALKAQPPLAAGSTQTVYQHPDDPNLLIKVRKREKMQKIYDRQLAARIGIRRRHGLYTAWMRELQHYFSVHLRLGYRPEFLQPYYGVIDTDLGLGLVVGKVIDRSGNLAPMLRDIVRRSGLTADIRQKLNELFRQINELQVSTTDINVQNIAYAWSETAGDHLVVIEGIGVNTFIPLAKFSNYFNVQSNNRHFRKTWRSLENLERRRLDENR